MHLNRKTGLPLAFSWRNNLATHVVDRVLASSTLAVCRPGPVILRGDRFVMSQCAGCPVARYGGIGWFYRSWQGGISSAASDRRIPLRRSVNGDLEQGHEPRRWRAGLAVPRRNRFVSRRGGKLAHHRHLLAGSLLGAGWGQGGRRVSNLRAFIA